MHDARDVLHVDAAGGHVGRDEHAELAALEGGEGPVARRLFHLARERRRGEAGARELARHGGHVGPGAREDEDLLVGVGEQEVHERVDPLASVDEVHDVLDVGVRDAQPRALDVHGLGLRRIGERLHLAREGGRDEMRPPAAGDERDDRVELVAEPHVEQAVRLVEHHDADRRGVDGAPLEVIEQPARRPHDDRGPAGERATLVAHAGASRDGHDARAQRCVEPRELLLDLTRELAGGGHDDGPRSGQSAVGGRPALRDQRPDREPDRDRLAGAGLRRDAQVAALERRVEHRGLDRGERLEAPSFEGLREVRSERRREGRDAGDAGGIVGQTGRSSRGRLMCLKSIKTATAARAAGRGSRSPPCGTRRRSRSAGRS